MFIVRNVHWDYIGILISINIKPLNFSTIAITIAQTRWTVAVGGTNF